MTADMTWRRTVAAWAVSLGLLVLAGCTVVIDSQPHNTPFVAAAGGRPAAALALADSLSETSVALSFSGGGARAAAFALGALHGLDALPAGPAGSAGSLLDQLRFITSVSGGSMTAAYYGLHGKQGLAEFRQVALLRDSEALLRSSLFNPMNIARLLAGGLNDRSTFQWWLDDEVFKHATFADMSRPGRPLVWINATNLRQRIAFPFHQGAFDAICSDLASYPVAEAVAASMAVPLVFTPIVLEKHPERCADTLPEWVDMYALTFGESMLSQSLLQALRDFRDTSSGRFVKLVDGGLSDNFGLTSIQQLRMLTGSPNAPWSDRDAINVRNLLFVVVDGGRQPTVDWTRIPSGPNGLDLALASIDAAIDTNVRLSYDSFVPMIRRWQDDMVRYRCGLPPDEQARIRAEKNGRWQCDDVRFTVTRLSFNDLAPARAAALHAVPMRLKLPPADIDALIAAGRDAMVNNLAVRNFVARVQAAAPGEPAPGPTLASQR